MSRPRSRILASLSFCDAASFGLDATQDRLDALDEQSLRKRLPNEIVGAHLETEQFVDLLVLRGEEYDGKIGLLPQSPQ